MRASSPTGVCYIAEVAVSRFAAGLAVVRRGGIYPSRGRLRRRGGCGTMRASSPTGVCHRTGFAVSRSAAGLAVVRRGGIYPSRGCSRCGGGCGRGMPLPYMPSGNDRSHGKAEYPPCGKPIVGADSISARGVCGVARLPGRDESRPYEQILRFAPPGRPRRFPRFVGEGFIPPAGVCGAAGVAGRCKHRPLQGFVISRRFAVSRLAARPPPI